MNLAATNRNAGFPGPIISALIIGGTACLGVRERGKNLGSREIISALIKRSRALAPDRRCVFKHHK